mgnify:CR=1 FL=1
MIKLKDILKEDSHEQPQEINADLRIPKGKTIVLQADTDEHKRGLIIRWKDDGGYDVAYWYDTPNNIVPAELKGDGKSFGDIKNVYLGVNNKMEVFKSCMNDNNLKTSETMFMGDDLPDIDIIKIVGLSCCPNDAASELRENPDVKEFYLGLSGDKRKSYRDGRSYRRRKRWLN